MSKELKTLIDVLYNTTEKYGNKIFIKYRVEDSYVSITYQEFFDMVEALACRLMEFGIKKEDKIGIISENMYKWLVADYACILLGAIDVPRGSDSTAVELEYILNHAEVSITFVENPQQADKLLGIIDKLPYLKTIVLLNGNTDAVQTKVKKIKIFTFDELLKEGYSLVKKNRKKLQSMQKAVTEDDLVTIIYTSGTTGAPKGVMLTHKNIMHNIRVLPSIIHITDQERWISILPVWHVFERTIEYIIIATYGLMGYSKPVAKYLLPDFLEIKPTFMVAVPRVYESLCQGIISKVKNGPKIKWFLFNFFLAIGIAYKKSYKILHGLEPLFAKEPFLKTVFKKIYSFFGVLSLFLLYRLGDILVYRTIREKTGGCLRGPISGGGALPEYVENFFCAIDMEILEGWGMTETSPVNGVKVFERLVPRTVGAPAPELEMKVCDENGVPLKNQHEMGIVFIKGPNVMKGYYKDPERTKAVLSEDGWLNTGDLGRFTLTGELQLTGRAKDTIVLIGGENIEPAPIEDRLLEHPLIHQVMIVGQDKKVLGALIVPHEENLIEFAKHHSIKFDSFSELCKNKHIIDEFKKICKNKINEKHGFKSYERITHIALISEPFKVGEELTHSLKMKRQYILDKYRSLIDKMFI